MNAPMSSFQKLAKVFETVDWIIPPYIQMGFLRKLAEDITKSDPNTGLQILENAFTILYDEEDLAVMFQERYSKTPFIEDFKIQIAEAIEASSLGLFHAAVAALTTVIEGVIRKIAQAHGREVGDGTKNLIKEVNHLVCREKSSRHSNHERVVMLETFHDFLKYRLLVNTKNYRGSGNLNRHGMFHGVFDGYGHRLNWGRMVSLLNLLCFSIACMKSGISLLAPAPTDSSRRLAAYYRGLKGVQNIAIKAGARQ